MRAAWYLVLGLGFVYVSCGDSSGTDGFFTPSGSGSGPSVTGVGGKGGASGSTGVGGSATSTGAAGKGIDAGSDGMGGASSVGAGGSGSVVDGGTTGGKAGAAGSAGNGGSAGNAGAAGASAGGGGAAGAMGGNAGAAGSMPDGGGGRSNDGGVGGGGTAGAGGGGTAGTGGAGGKVDAGRPDSGIAHPIRCGDNDCNSQNQYCCVRDGNTPPACVSIGGTCPDNADRVYCDDRNDCTPGLLCCAFEFTNGSSYATCQAICSNVGPRGRQPLCDPQEEDTCLGANSCRSDNNGIIPDYPYCH